MKQLPKTSVFCLSAAIGPFDHARSFSITETLEAYPELQQQKRLLTRLLEAMATADRTELNLQLQLKEIGALSESLRLALIA